MTDSKLEILKTKLKEELDKTREDVEALDSVSKPVEPDVAIGRLTRMEAIQSKSINEASLRKAKARIKNLESALRRIESDPDFGYCEECDDEIPMKRLLIMPETRYCVKCMAKLGG